MSKKKNTTTPAPESAAPAANNGRRTGVVPALRRDSNRALWDALRTHPGSTTAALAELAGIGQTTTRRLLTQWEDAGCIQSHTDPATPRAGKTWTQGVDAPATTEPNPAPAEPAPTAPDPTEPTEPEPVSTTTAEAAPETTGPTTESDTTSEAQVPAFHSAEARALWKALDAHPGSTTAELAKHVNLGTGTARHLLTEWELAGAVWAVTDPGKPRAGKNWTAGVKPEPAPVAPEPAATAPKALAPAAPTTPEPVAPEPAAPAEQAAPTDPAPDPAPETAVDAPTGDKPATGAPAAPAAADNTAAADAESTAERLPAGALRGQVEDFLHENPGKEFTPHQIGKALNRSSGAVHNALVTLTKQETARQTSTAPKKFTLAS